MQATFDSLTGDLLLLFDSSLQAPGSWDSSTFAFRIAPSSYTADDVIQNHATQITVRPSLDAAWAGDPECDYSDALATLVGTNGLPVASWTNFPVTVV